MQKSLAGGRNKHAGVSSHTHVDKIDHFIHIKNYFTFNLLQLTIDIKAMIPGTLCMTII
jgi:hypothetical protein